MNQQYVEFMVQLEQTLAQAPGGQDMYNTLVGNGYLPDPSTLTNTWDLNYTGLYTFAFTIITTIGYGSFAPKTPGGMIFTMVFALVRRRGTRHCRRTAMRRDAPARAPAPRSSPSRWAACAWARWRARCWSCSSGRRTC